MRKCSLVAIAASVLLVSGCHEKHVRPKPETPSHFIDRDATSKLFWTPSSADNTDLAVYIALPVDRSHPLKTVVVMHGSGGMWDDGDDQADVCNVGVPSRQVSEWQDLLTMHGFVAVFVDSYSSRGTCENEGMWKEPPAKFLISGTFIRNRDAYDVLAFAKSLGWSDDQSFIVDPNNIGILGFSDGGTSVLSTLYDTEATPTGWTWKQSFGGVSYRDEILPPPSSPEENGFKAGIAYYPGSYHNGYYGKLCDGQGIYRSYCDILFHVAENDDLSANTRCMISTMQQRGGGTAEVYEYENTEHSFDGNSQPQSTQARNRTIEFLKAHLK